MRTLHGKCYGYMGDCHPGNILWRDEVVMVDFDDSRMGPAVQDFWMLLNVTARAGYTIRCSWSLSLIMNIKILIYVNCH